MKKILFLLVSLAAPASFAQVALGGWQCQYSTNGEAGTEWTLSTSGAECYKGKAAGYVFYRSKIKIEPGSEARAQGLGLFVGTIGDADETYVNGKLVGKTGAFPPKYLNTMHRPRMYYLGSEDGLQDAEVLIKTYSEFPVNRGLLLSSVKIGPYETISKLLFWEDFKATTGLPLILTLFLITTFFTLFLWIQRPKERFHLWAAGTTLFMATYTFFLSRYGYELNFSNLINYRALVSSAMLTTICLAAFAVSFAKSKLTPALWAFGTLNLAYLFYIQRFDSILEFRGAYKIWFLMFVLIVGTLAAHFALCIRRNPKVKFVLIGTILFLAAALNDISITLGLRSGPSLAQYGLAIFALVFILTEVYVLTSKIKDDARLEASRKSRELISEAILQQSIQVAHDIRSPLAALSMVVEDISELSEDKRLLVRGSVSRIQDIANNLLPNASHSHREESAGKSVHLLSSLVESLISEKRLALRQKPEGVELETRLGSDAYGIFSNIDAGGLNRVLSNLVDNSVEAIDGRGLVTVSVKANNNSALIIVADNGQGIPQETLPLLTEKGASFGKTAGSGLGLFAAKMFVEEMGGTLLIESITGLGTKITICLPRAPNPTWFVPKITVAPGLVVCALDDDPTIHQIWNERFERVRGQVTGLKLLNFTTADEFCDWFGRNKEAPALYLCDYELLGQNANGLEIIEKLGVQTNAILVTSRYDETLIREKCEKLGVKLIPKGLAGFVPIEAQDESSKICHILLDDDPLMLKAWQKAAKENGIELTTLRSSRELLAMAPGLNRKTQLYIDSDLGEAVKGEEIALNLYEMGFREIFLTTGYPPSKFEGNYWLKEITGKLPPWRKAL